MKKTITWNFNYLFYFKCFPPHSYWFFSKSFQSFSLQPFILETCTCLLSCPPIVLSSIFQSLFSCFIAFCVSAFSSYSTDPPCVSCYLRWLFVHLCPSSSCCTRTELNGPDAFMTCVICITYGKKDFWNLHSEWCAALFHVFSACFLAWCMLSDGRTPALPAWLTLTS